MQNIDQSNLNGPPEYREHTVPQDLRFAVQRIWSLTADVPTVPNEWETVIPDGTCELVIHRATPWAHRIAGTSVERQPTALFSGQIAGPIHLRSNGSSRIIGLRLEPSGARALTGIPQHELTNRIVSAASVMPTPVQFALRRARAADTEINAINIITETLRDQLDLQKKTPPQTLADHAATLIHHSNGGVTIDALAKTLHVSSRQLERTFRSHIGIGPKTVARIARLQYFIDRFRNTTAQPYALIAARCGYFDEPHLVREFNALTGQSPRRYLRSVGIEIPAPFNLNADQPPLTAPNHVAFVQFGHDPFLYLSQN